MRILLVCERLSGPDDEGIKNLATALIREMGRSHVVEALTSRTAGPLKPDVIQLPMNRFFLNSALARRARAFRPDRVVYVPWTSGTPRTFLRARILTLLAGAPVAVVLTQPYRSTRWERWFIRRVRPALVLAQSPAVVEDMRSMDMPAVFLPSGVDLIKFRILDARERLAAREAFGIPATTRVLLHVGHLNSQRMDPEEMARLARLPGWLLLVVGSTDTPQDDGVVHALEAAGARVVREYLPRIELLYGSADLYLFPTRAPRSSIGVPLSVIEALACGLPVVATRFEGLPGLFPDTPWVRFFDSFGEVERAMADPPAPANPRARALVESLAWPTVAKRLGELLEDLPHPARPRARAS